MSSNKLKKFQSFRINRENVKNNSDRNYNVKKNRRQSFSHDLNADDVDDSSESDFQKTLLKWREWDSNSLFSSADKRKSVSIHNVCDYKSMRKELSKRSELNSFISERNLLTVADSIITGDSKAKFKAKLENALAKGPSPKVNTQKY